MLKVGDRVRVTDKYPSKFDNLIGKVGIVVKIDGDIWPIEVKLDDGTEEIFNENELELEN